MTQFTPLHLGWCLDEADGRPLYLEASGLKAGTVIIAQSGSGKSFTLGRLLEEIAAKTRARIVILDPNSDFVKLSEVETNAWQTPYLQPWFGPDDTLTAFRERWAKVGFGLLTSREPAALQLTHPRAEIAPISLSWGSLEPMVQASVLGFSPMDAPNEVLVVYRIHEAITEKQARQRSEGSYSLAAFEDHALALYEAITGTGEQETFAADAGRIPAHAALRVLARVHELGLLGIWDLTEAQQGVMARLLRLGDEETTQRVVGVDLASLESPEGRLVAAEGALAALWQMARHKWVEAIRKSPGDDVRYPVFIVIDEAHNLAPAQPTTTLTRYVTDFLVRIAAEGRKYGLYLIMVTQHPGRLHPTLLSQCANLCLMKMNNRFDLDLVEQGFGFLPEGAVRRALQFKIGDALLAGKFVAAPTYAHIAPRRTMEGGRNLVDRFWLQEPQ